MSRWILPSPLVQARARTGPAEQDSSTQPVTTEAAAAAAAAAAPLTLDDLNAVCDPYLRWAVLTDWRGFANAGSWAAEEPAKGRADQEVRVILKAADEAQMRLLLSLPMRTAGLAVPPVYGRPLKPGGELSLYATLTVKVSLLSWLLHSFQGLSWKLCAPLKIQGTGVSGSAKGYYGRQFSTFEAKAAPPSSAAGQTNTAQAAGLVRGGVMAVVDFGCPFLHSCLASPRGSTSRLAALWDQGDSRIDEPWRTPSEMGYGGMLGPSTLRQEWAQIHETSAAMDEAEAYKRLDYLREYEDARSRVYRTIHGAHVLDVAGGAVDPATGDRDSASSAKLVFVQLPFETAADSSGGSLAAHLLDALRFVFHVADPQSPLVVNISYGSTAGPHDGSSIVERAMDELLENRPMNTAIVLAAGNSRRAGLHLKRSAYPGCSAMFRIDVAVGDNTDTFVEFWYEAPAKGRLEFRARLPAGQWSAWLEPDRSVELTDEATKEPVALLVHQAQVPNGCRSMALLAMRPTEAPDGDEASLAEPGIWEVEVRLEASGQAVGVAIDAWVERDDPRPFSSLKQTRFLDPEPNDADDTLCSIATGEHTIVVGGFRESDGVEVGYSSTGPRTPKKWPKQWPMVHAICERDTWDQGLRAAAVRSGETFLMNGTSVAAPVMARHIYNLFQGALKKDKRGLSREELLQSLRIESQRPGALIRVANIQT